MLTQAQKVTLKNHALANQATVAAGAGTVSIASLFAAGSLSAGDAVAIADWYNQNAAPDFWGFPESVSVETVYRSITPAEFLVLASQAATTNLYHNGIDLLLRNGVIHPGSPEVRTWLQTLFPQGTAPLSRSAILAACTRLARNIEAVFATAATGPAGGNGSAQNAAANFNFEGTVSGNDIADVHGVPI